MRRWLLLLTAATTALVLAALLVPLALLTRSHAADRATAEATARAQYVASGAGTMIGSGTSTGDEARHAAASFVEGANSPGGPATSLILADGTALGAPARVTDAVRLARTGRAFTYAPPDGGRTVLVPVQGARGGTAVVQVAVNSRQLYDGMLTSWLTFAGIGVCLVLAGLLIADRLGARLVGSARRLSGVAERLSAGDLEARAEPQGPPELRLVAGELNHLAARIGELLAAERENAADLAHRLRTPLAALRLDAECLGDADGAERICAGVEALEQQVDEVIRRARRPLHDRTRHSGSQRADLAAVARERAAFWLPLAEDQGREVRVEVPDGLVLPVPVPEDELAAAVDALIGNVLDHTPHGTGFRVTVTAARDAEAAQLGRPVVAEDGCLVAADDGCLVAAEGGRLVVAEGGCLVVAEGGCLVVADDGPGFPVAYAAQRGHSAGGSTGLGLDIVRRTAQEAGGAFEVSGPGELGGARVTLTLPGNRPETPPAPAAPTG
ncbi:sensor histidine kinase [Streptomyces sp. NPDC002851]